jgi:hypothetical protein
MTPDKKKHPEQKPAETPDIREKKDDNPIKINPNPRANENIPAEKKRDGPDQAEGIGSEITDGEDG